jgi:hypothetical protein
MSCLGYFFARQNVNGANMRQNKIYIFSSLVAGLLMTATPLSGKSQPRRNLQPSSYESSDEEAFLIRRIAEFWKDGDYEIVKSQIHQFLEKYPSSSLNDYLLGILGDLYLQEAKYAKAVAFYNEIRDPSIVEKIILNKLQGYYELNKYAELSREGEVYLYNTSADFVERRDEFHFLMAEAYFRQALQSDDDEYVKTVATKARPFYEGLLQSDYSEVSTFALAEIYRLQKENEKGSNFYLQLAEHHSDKREQLLFNAAVLKAHVDKGKAMEIFDQVIELKGEKSNDASYNRLLLAFQTEQFSVVIEKHRSVYPYVPEDQVPLYNFIVGKSYYSVEDYKSAAQPIAKYLNANPEVSDQYKDALLIQMTCAKSLNDEELFLTGLEKYRSAFPRDEELGKAYFMHAMMCKNEHNFAMVEQDLATISQDFPQFEDRESLLYEYGLVTHQNERWGTSYQIFQDYLAQYASHERAESAWRHFLSCCLNLSKADNAEEMGYSKERFLNDLEVVLSKKNGLDANETREYRLLYTKLSYEIGYHSEALVQLSKYIADYSEHDSVAEAHLLSALSLNKLNGDLTEFCEHLENAMKLNPSEYDNSSIHLQLYNGYITLFETNGNNPSLTEMAANHLYSATQNPDQDIRYENRIWLAGHYYAKVKGYLEQNWQRLPENSSDMQLAFDRSIELYEDAFQRKKIDATRPELEPEALKYADLLSYKNEVQSKLSLLQGLIEVQNTHPDVDWKFRRQTLFELAQTYEILKAPSDALETYQFILSEANGVISPITNMSMLRSSVIRYNQIPEKQRSEKNSEVLTVLNQLKELQIRKSIDSEPTHFESALHYANIRAELSDPQIRDSRYIFFLVRIKEDYTSNDDIINQEYHAALASNPAKQQLFDNYMKFVEAEIFRVQSHQLIKENKQEASKFHQMSADIFGELQNHGALTTHLDERVAKSMRTLEKHRIR